MDPSVSSASFALASPSPSQTWTQQPDLVPAAKPDPRAATCSQLDTEVDGIPALGQVLDIQQHGILLRPQLVSDQQVGHELGAQSVYFLLE